MLFSFSLSLTWNLNKYFVSKLTYNSQLSMSMLCWVLWKKMKEIVGNHLVIPNNILWLFLKKVSTLQLIFQIGKPTQTLAWIIRHFINRHFAYKRKYIHVREIWIIEVEKTYDVNLNRISKPCVRWSFLLLWVDGGCTLSSLLLLFFIFITRSHHVIWSFSSRIYMQH